MAENNRLILTPDQQLSMGGQVREAKKNTEGEAGAEETAEKEQMSWRQRLNIRRRAREKARAIVKEKVQIPAKMVSARAWNWAWFSLLPSWGLSLIILDILWFGSLITNLICKPGEEWIPKKVLATGGDAGKLAAKSIGIVERMGLVALNLIAFFIVMAVLTILAWLSDSIVYKLIDKVLGIWGWVWK